MVGLNRVPESFSESQRRCRRPSLAGAEAWHYIYVVTPYVKKNDVATDTLEWEREGKEGAG